VKRVICNLDLKQSNRLGQIAVHGPPDLVLCAISCEAKRNDLALSMDASVRATGAVDNDRLSIEPCESLLQLTLNGPMALCNCQP
jgi:hypothetical protein